VLYNRKERTVTVGKLGDLNFKKGFYFYIGSAKIGVNRILRHFKKEKKKKWHIDYITDTFEVVGAILTKFEECELSNYVSKFFDGVKGFGCSDCKCYTHLYYSPIFTLEFLPT